MTFNILRNSIIRNDTSCRHDNNDGWAVVWDENDNFRQYTEVGGLTSMLVWDRSYVAVTTSGSCYVGPSQDQTPVNALVYSTIKLNMRIELNSSTSIVPTTGKIQFQTDDDPIYDSEKVVEFPILVDNAYNEYIIDMSQVRKWTGNITRLRIYPFIDGAAGYIVHFKSLRVESSNIFSCDTGFQGTVCSRFSEYAHPCPWVGRGGSSQTSLVNDGIDIIQGVNDKLILDINGYGEQAITLTPVRGARLKDVGRDIEEKLSNIGIGGYAGARVDVVLNRLKITADDTREADSTLHVADTAAARTLGFYSSQGEPLYTELNGEEAASRYEPAGTIQLSKSQLSQLYRSDAYADGSGIELDLGKYALKGGREDFALTYKDVKIDFTGKTIIDFNNPINVSGVVTSLSYSGDGFPTTEFRIFRPKADGSIECIFSVSLGLSDSVVDGVFEVSVNVRVRKGDFLGIYDGLLDSGKLEEVPNGSYIIYDGNLDVGFSIETTPVISGRGEAGLRLFAHGADKQSAVVLNMEFEQQELIEEITVIAEEESRTEEVNLTHALAGGLNGGIYVTATTGVDKFGAPAPGWTNLSSLFDKVQFDGPGATNAHPLWLDSSYQPPDKYDFTEMTLLLEFAKAVPVLFNVNRVVVYFKDPNNIKFFGLEYPVTTNDTDTLQYFGKVADIYNEVYLEGKLLLPNDHPLYSNPIQPTVTNFIDGYQVLEYRKIDLRFDPVKARALKYCVRNYVHETDVSRSDYSDFPIAPSPRIMEMEVYAQSVPTASIADNFSFESSTDDSKYYNHTKITVEGPTSARYLIGYPVQYVRARIEPQGRLVIRNFQISTSQARTRVKVGGALDGSVSLNIGNEDFTTSQAVAIKNETSSFYNYYINISSQRSTPDKCILWNKLDSAESVALSEVGASAIVKKRDRYSPREYNYAYAAPAYVLDPFWMLNNNCKSYISYDGTTWESRGNMMTDYNDETYLTSENALAGQFFVYVLIDLGQVYALDTVQIVNPAGFADFDGPLYSSRDVSDPTDLDLVNDFTGVKSQTRWLRFRAFSDAVGALTGVAAISYVQASLDPISLINYNKLPWVEAPLLTNYIMGDTQFGGCGEGWQCSETGFNNWYAVDMGGNYKITNLIVGPVSNAFVELDVDTLEPGDSGTLFDDDENFNSNVAFAATNLSDPKKVRWSVLGVEPGVNSRWILVRRVSNILDELIVHVEDNVQENKPPFAEPRWWTSTYGEVVKDKSEYPEGTHSISITYPEDNDGSLEEMELTQSLGIDHVLAKRDQLRLLIYLSDASQLDTTKGHITLGRNTTEQNLGRTPLDGVEKDRDNYFQWPMSELPTLGTGWNEVFLPFTDNFRVGRPKFEEDDLLTISNGDISGRSRMRWFRVAFAGVEGNEAFDLKLTGIEVVRGEYLPGHFGDALYLSGNEYVKFPLNNFNIFEGTIEFYLDPDWSKDPGCHTCEDGRDHTLFRIFNEDGFVLGGFMTGVGLRIYMSDGTNHYFLTDNSSVRLKPGVSSHFAVTWDLLGRKSTDSIRVYIDNVLSSSFLLEAIEGGEFKPNPGATLMLGGYAWGGVTERRVSSVDGTVSNLKVFNFAKTDFAFSMENQGLEVIRPSDDLIEISLNGVDYFGSADRGDGLPLLYRNVAPGQTFNVYIRRKESDEGFPELGQDRTAFIEVLRTTAG